MALQPQSTALLVFDMLEGYRQGIEEAGVLDAVATLIDACRGAAVPIVYARADHRADGADRATAPTDTDSNFQPWSDDRQRSRLPKITAGSRESEVVAELAPQAGDYVIFKHRWNAFFQTPLELSLRTRGVTTVLVVGGSTHVGIASTVYAGRDMDFDMVVVSNGLTGLQPQRDFFVSSVFPRMCRVMTSEAAVAALQQHD